MNLLSAYWGALAGRWDALLADPAGLPNREEAFRRFHWFLKRVIKVGNRTKTFRLLDLGCGTGEAAWPLWKRVASVTFLDLSPAMLRLARNKYPKGVFVCGDAAAMPFLDAEFDVIVSRGALISQIEQPKSAVFLSQAWRVLRPHGLFLFDFVCNPEAWPGDRAIYASTWNRARMGELIAKILPAATIVAWDGTERHGLNRVVIRK